ncbi:MAG: CPBP family intramembrane glutamic endopeptidase [Planctomycetota bacterium]
MIESCRSLFAVRSVGWKMVVLVVVVHVVLSTLMNFVVFPSEVLDVVEKLTFGLVNSTLQANLLYMLIMFPLIFVVGGLKPGDVALAPATGSESTTIWKGLIWTLVALALVHIGSLIAIVCNAGPLQLSATIENGFFNKSGLASTGLMLGQVFGNASYEEILFRGFLLPQLLLLFKKRNRKWSWTKCFWLALFVSQFVFSIQHLPNLIYRSGSLDVIAICIDLVVLLVCGLVLAAVFLLTRNLYAAIGIHAIANYTPMLITMPIVGLQFLAYFVVFVAYLWNRRRKRA